MTGRSFADLLQDGIFDPVGMTHSWLPGRSKPIADTPEPALIHTGRQALEVPQLVESSNDLISTAGDLLSFQQALIRGELFDQPTTIERLTESARSTRLEGSACHSGSCCRCCAPSPPPERCSDNPGSPHDRTVGRCALVVCQTG